MARPVPRRRGASDDDAPSADKYTGRRGRAAADDEPEEERRPRRGRGELPDSRKAKKEEPPVDLPTSKRAVSRLSDDDFDALAEFFDLDVDSDDIEDELWDAIESYEPEPDEEPEPPRRGRGRRAEPDDEDEPPARGRGRGRAAKDDDEDEKPARGRGRGRSRDDEDDEDDTPRRTAARGFQGYKRTREATSSFADDFKLTDEEVLVKFLEDEPFAAYGEHGLFQELRDGQRVWPCLAPEEDCPICDTGHAARAVALWNIVVIPEEGKPQIKVLKAGPKLEKLIEKKAALKTGPMSKEYYSLSQTAGKNDGPVEYTVEVVRERDLEEDWKEKPFTDDELEAFESKMFDNTFVKFPSVKDMKAVARKLRDAD